MFRFLLLLIVLVLALEIWVIILFGKLIGAPLTLLLIILTGLLGAHLAKKEGLSTFRQAQEQMGRRQIPGESILDGLCVIIGGGLLIIPGFITDLIGLFLLFKPTRRVVKEKFKAYLRKKMDNGDFTFYIRK